MLNIRTAGSNEYELVRGFYHSLISEMKSSNAKYMPGWEIDIYPAPEYLRDSIAKKELYIGEVNGQVVSCMIMNHDSNEGYHGIKWSLSALPNEITVIHALGVHPGFSGNAMQERWSEKLFVLPESIIRKQSVLMF